MSHHIVHVHRGDLKFQGKKVKFIIFHFVILALARQEERGNRLIILHVWNIMSSEFLIFLFIPRIGCKTPNLSKMCQLLKVWFDYKA